jgi:hypothetical protein
MPSLKERIEWLERELPPNPPRFKVHDDLPFAILRYDPEEEWQVRREIRHLTTRLTNRGIGVETISLAELLWAAIERNEGLSTLVDLERERGFDAAQEQVNVYLSDEDFSPLSAMLADRLQRFVPERTICFLTRAASLGPSIYHLSKLLNEMQGRTRVPTVLFYPGSLQGANALCFMGLPDREPLPNYRVKIYG